MNLVVGINCLCIQINGKYKYFIGPWFPMVNADHKDRNDHMANGLQIWQEIMDHGKILYCNFQNIFPMVSPDHMAWPI